MQTRFDHSQSLNLISKLVLFQFSHIAIWGSIVTWFVFFVVYSYFWPALPVGENMVGMANNVLASAIFWFGLILIPVAVLFRDLLWKV